MRIGIHAADLDHQRIDGTRVYIFNVLKKLGKIDNATDFVIYHRNSFNPKLAPPAYGNYHVKSLHLPIFWTQIRFALEIFRDKPDVLWMPVQNVPIFKSKKTKVAVTIHDLAFKIFPQHFTKKDLFKLNLLAGIAIKKSDKIIAISNSTKKDILRFYPEISEEKIKVVYNGYDKELFEKRVSDDEADEFLKNYKLKANSYLLYVGAIQPRKNLEVLIEAFENLKSASNPQLKLMLAGAPAWKYESVIEKIAKSRYSDDIMISGTVPFEKLPVLYQKASAFIFPSLYEGFGIPILEAMASGVPVITANNSSLTEIGGNAVSYFESEDSIELAGKIKEVLSDEAVRSDLIKKGLERAKDFSWDKCAKETLNVLSNL